MKEREIFDAALAIADPEKRDAFLAAACGGDTAQEQHLRNLLAAERGLGSFLEEPAVAATLTADPPRVAEGVGTVIGPYNLLEPIGEGGMGTVFMAEQARPVRRRVVLKVIKAGMDTKQVVARFEAERQALALMDHPNIARVLDAGATDGGRPYFVMELVRGIPITDYCDREQLSVPGRLELFVLVCRAVQHAHQKGVIHRDLKPSNVLVTEVDGVAVPKVIDFGVAKATGQALTERSLFTGFHQFVGTPLYMSPEQADLAGVDVDTRSDVYSLGVLLYELLTGTTPFDREAFRKATLDEVRRIVREPEPPTPSTRLSTLGESLPRVSANRKAEPRQLNREVRGELDWIVMRAVEKDRKRRYETANDFAADVMRHLTDQPVEACPPSGWYRFSKYARRHRAALTTAVLVGLTLVGGMATSGWQAVRATGAERLAIRRLQEVQRANAATTLALNQSEEERRKADAVVEFLFETFRKPDPSLDGRELKVVDLIDDAAARLGDDFSGDPKTRIAMLHTLGHTRLGRPAEAIRQVEIVLKIVESRPGSDRRVTFFCRHNLAPLYDKADRPADAEPLYRGAVAWLRENPGDRKRLALDLSNLGSCLLKQGKAVEAEPPLREALEIRARVLPEEWQRFWTMSSLGEAMLAQGKFAEAEPLVVEGYAGVETRQAKIPKESKLAVPKAGARVVRLYEAWGKPEKAEEWRKRLGLPELPDDVFARPRGR